MPTYLFNYESKEEWDKAYSMLLTAYVTGTAVRFKIHSTLCNFDYPMIERVAFGREGM